MYEHHCDSKTIDKVIDFKDFESEYDSEVEQIGEKLYSIAKTSRSRK